MYFSRIKLNKENDLCLWKEECKVPIRQVETLLDAYIDKFWFVHNAKVKRKELEREKLREAGNSEREEKAEEEDDEEEFWLEDDIYVFLYYNSFLVQ